MRKSKMTIAILGCIVVFLIVAFILLSTVQTMAGQPYGTNWGKWGPKDQLGTLNYITRQKIREASKLIKKGEVFNLGINLKRKMPCWTGRNYQHYMSYILPSLSAEGGVGFTNDVIVMDQQYSTQWDGFPHCLWDGKMYNGHPVSKITALNGTAELSIHQWSDKIVSRGVLLDIAKLKNVSNLAKGYIITPADLDAACKAQNVKVTVGDIVCVRTGWLNVMLKWTLPLRGKEPYQLGEPGIGLQACKWLKDKKVAAIACDNLGVEAIPFDPEDVKKVNDKGFKGFPVHVELLVHQGMPLGEIWDFEELAKSCAADGIYEFMLVAPPLRIVGGVGTPLSPLAIK